MILLSTTLRTAVTTPLLRKGHLSASAGSINDAGAQGRGPERVPGGGDTLMTGYNLRARAPAMFRKGLLPLCYLWDLFCFVRNKN